MLLSPNNTQRGKNETQSFDPSSKIVHASADSLGYAAESSSLDCLVASECKSTAVADERRTNKLPVFSSSRTTNRNLLQCDDVGKDDECRLPSQLIDMTAKNYVAGSASSLSIETYVSTILPCVKAFASREHSIFRSSY